MDTTKTKTTFNWINIVGIILIVVGLVILASIYFNMTKLFMFIPPILGFLIAGWGGVRRRSGLLIAGSLLLGAGIGVLVGFGNILSLRVVQQIGISLGGLGASWLLIYFLSRFYLSRNHWWALIPAIIIGSLGACFYFSPLRLLDFVIYLGVAIGFSILLPGLMFRLFGLIIPGCLVVFASAAVYLGWGAGLSRDPLTQTGIMLVVFAIGWAFITLGSRLITDKFVWWPLIPAGILAMTGWGLYIAGDPDSALSFIGNTGSIGLIILGLYLILLRRGLHR